MTIFGIDLSPERYEYLVNIPKEKLFGWLEAGIGILPNFVVAIITLLLFYPIAKGAKWAAGKIYRRTSDNFAIHALVQNFVFLIFIFIGLFSALEILQLEKTVASLLAGAGVVGLAMGFAFQEIASNFVSGILITFRKPYRVGDSIEVQNRRGTVRSIDMRTTSIINGQGLEVIIPNKIMITDVLTNYSSTKKRKVEIIVGVSYDSDLDKVQNVALRAVKDVSHRLEKESEVFFQSFGDSAINCKVSFWVDYSKDSHYDQAIHEGIMNIKNAFDENAIEIPFPTRTILQSKN